MCDGVNLLSSDLRHVFTTSSQNVVVTQEAGSHSPIKYSVSDAETGLQSRKNVQNGQFVTYLESAPLPDAEMEFESEASHATSLSLDGKPYISSKKAFQKAQEGRGNAGMLSLREMYTGKGGFVQPIVQETAESDVKGDMQCIDVDESYNTLRGEWQK
eukprot:gene17418-20730_t